MRGDGMSYRALFIGGPIDGQERVLTADHPHISVPAATYRLLFAFGVPKTLVYSVWDVTETFSHVWHHYTGGKYA
jgi:hypothetical protein